MAVFLSEEDILLLEQSPPFKGLNKEDLLNLLASDLCEVRCFARGEEIFQAGSRISQTGILLAGNAHIERIDFKGNRSLLREIKQGDIFGEVFAVIKMPLLNDVSATKPSRIFFLELDRIADKDANLPQARLIVLNLLTISMQRNLYLVEKARCLSQRTTREKLLAYLFFCQQKFGSDSFDIPFDRQQLADYLAVDRSALSTEIGKLTKEGKIKSHKNHFEMYGPNDKIST